MPRAGARRLFRSILCPIDFSDQSASALRYAAALKQRSAGRLTAIFVVDPRLIDAAVNAWDERGLERASLAQLRRFVPATLPRGAATDVRCVTAFGTPAQGMKLFYRQDVGLFDAAEVMGLAPVPSVVIYQ